MAPRHPALLDPPICFAHRGARAHAPENTIEAFHLARRLGATGIESDVWLSADGVPVLDHDGVLGRRFRRRTVAETARADLPEHIPTLEEYYAEVGTDLPLSLDLKDADAFDATVAVARAAGALEGLWLCHPSVDRLAEWRGVTDDVRLVNSTRQAALDGGEERRAADLSARGIDAVNLPRHEWNGGAVAVFHRFGVLAFGWDAQLDRHLDELLDIGADAVYSDHVDRMVDAFARIYP